MYAPAFNYNRLPDFTFNFFSLINGVIKFVEVTTISMGVNITICI